MAFDTAFEAREPVCRSNVVILRILPPSGTEEGIQDFLDISVRVRGITRLLFFLKGYWYSLSYIRRNSISNIIGRETIDHLVHKNNFCSCLLTDNGTHPCSIYRLSSETGLVSPRTILAASFCSFSRGGTIVPNYIQYITEYSSTGKPYET